MNDCLKFNARIAKSAGRYLIIIPKAMRPMASDLLGKKLIVALSEEKKDE